MVNAREIVAAGIGIAMFVGAGAYLYTVYRTPPVPFQDPAPAVDTLRIPTVDEMCKQLGAAEGDALKQCQADQNAAGEFVIAWMTLNNFIVGGSISLEQIQAVASLDDATPALGLGTDAAAGLDPSDPSSGGFDVSATGLGDSPSQITAGIDPATGQPNGFLQSPAQLALYCLQMSSDWVTMQNCISDNDPSSHLQATP